MYNLVPKLSQEKVDGMYLPPAGKGKSAYPQKNFKNLQIVKFGTGEVDEGKIYTLNR